MFQSQETKKFDAVILPRICRDFCHFFNCLPRFLTLFTAIFFWVLTLIISFLFITYFLYLLTMWTMCLCWCYTANVIGWYWPITKGVSKSRCLKRKKYKFLLCKHCYYWCANNCL